MLPPAFGMEPHAWGAHISGGKRSGDHEALLLMNPAELLCTVDVAWGGRFQVLGGGHSGRYGSCI